MCGGPAVTGLDVACMSQDNMCSGTMVCNAAGTAAECNAPHLNECSACFPSVGTIGADCTDPNRGCAGLTACNGTGDAVVCTQDANCGHIVISELATDSATCNTDEFVERYNPTGVAQDISGWRIQYMAASGGGGWQPKATVPANTSIPPRGYYLIGGPTYAGTVYTQMIFLFLVLKNELKYGEKRKEAGH